MTARVLGWLATKASEYLVWLDARERRYNRKLNGACPDCGEGPLYCYCNEAADEQRRYRDLYDSGFVDGYSDAMERVAE